MQASCFLYVVELPVITESLYVCVCVCASLRCLCFYRQMLDFYKKLTYLIFFLKNKGKCAHRKQHLHITPAGAATMKLLVHSFHGRGIRLWLNHFFPYSLHFKAHIICCSLLHSTHWEWIGGEKSLLKANCIWFALKNPYLRV